jgi:rubredoxin
MGGILDKCPECGIEKSEFEVEVYEDSIYFCEDYYCPNCGIEVGGFTDPINV